MECLIQSIIITKATNKPMFPRRLNASLGDTLKLKLRVDILILSIV